jgi:hypothetical protein
LRRTYVPGKSPKSDDRRTPKGKAAKKKAS